MSAVNERSRAYRGRLPEVKAHHGCHLFIGHERLHERDGEKRERERDNKKYIKGEIEEERGAGVEGTGVCGRPDFAGFEKRSR